MIDIVFSHIQKIYISSVSYRWNNEKHSCNLCGLLFSHFSNLRKHQRNIHHLPMILTQKMNTNNDFQCLRCLKSFSRKTNLRRHQIKVHKMERNELEYVIAFGCNYCPKTFNDVVNLKLHRKIEHSNENHDVKNLQLPFCVHECAHCGETFQKKDSLRRHMKVRHFSDVIDYKLLKDIMPDWKNDICVIKYSVLNKDEGQFFAKFSINLRNKNELNKWLSEFQCKNKITLRKRSIHPSVKATVLYHVKYGCHHNTKPRLGTHVSGKHTKCQATVQCKIFSSIDESKNYTEIRLTHIHNHAFNSLDVLKYREPTAETKMKFRLMFLSGMTPSQALQQHRKDLEQKYGNEFHNIEGDRGICPNRAWVYNYRLTCLKKIENSISETTITPKFVKLPVSSGNVIITSPKCQKIISDYIKNTDNPNSTYTDSKLPINDDTLSHAAEELTLFCNSIPENDLTSSKKSLDISTTQHNDYEVQIKSDYVDDMSDVIESYSEDIKIDEFSPDVHETHIHEVQLSQFSELDNMEKYKSIPVESASVDFILNEFDQINSIIKNMARENLFLLGGIQQMINTFEKNLRDPVLLNNALYTFGKDS